MCNHYNQLLLDKVEILNGIGNPLISIITPSFNSEKYITDTIESVLNQSFKNFEMIIVDDCSSDSTCKIVESYMNTDDRIKLYKLENNSGAAVARNTALDISKGRFIAYLDADDIWKKDKLEKQVSFMLSTDIAFSCTSYEVIDDLGKDLEKEIHMLIKVDYESFLKNNLLQTVGIMVDTSKIDKSLLKMPLIRRRQDAATWLQILKAGYPCYGLDLILAQYRRTDNSLSSNKIKAIKGIWYLYRKIENLSLMFSCYCFVRYAFLAIWKRIYFKRYQK
ncbi:MAG: glycosyltransferase [Erysipelotrichaceae bacterium]|nr:glycosyltransferase [Erysipelotrichaceae bacterium]